MFLITCGVQIYLVRVCILILLLDTSVYSRVVKTRIFVRFLVILWLFSNKNVSLGIKLYMNGFTSLS